MLLTSCQKQKDQNVGNKNPTLSKDLAYADRTLTAPVTKLKIFQSTFYTGTLPMTGFTELQFGYDSCTVALNKISNMYIEIILKSDSSQRYTSGVSATPIEYLSLYGVQLRQNAEYILRAYATVAQNSVGRAQIKVAIPYFWGDGYNNTLSVLGQEIRFRPPYRSIVEIQGVQNTGTLLDSNFHDGGTWTFHNFGTTESAIKQVQLNFEFVRNANTSGIFNLFNLQVFWGGQDITNQIAYVNPAGDTLSKITETDTVVYVVHKTDFRLFADDEKFFTVRWKPANFGSGNQNGYKVWMPKDKLLPSGNQRYVNKKQQGKQRAYLSSTTTPDPNAFPSGIIWSDGSGNSGINGIYGFSTFNWYNSYYLNVNETKQVWIN